MRVFMYTLGFLLILNGCQKDRGTDSIPDSNFISLDKILEYVPMDLYTAYSKAVFMDDQGRKKIMNIRVTQDYIEAPDGTPPLETMAITLTDPATNAYWINIDVKINALNNRTGYYEYITGQLYTWANQGLIPSIGIYQTGQPALCQFLPEIVLVGKRFEQVYTNYPLEPLTGYKRVYYNASHGMIGFDDEHGVLWALHEYQL